jgi:Thioesterase-like superfamily
MTAHNASMEDSFYVQVDDQRYESTALTRGPWDAGAQHAGPPAALLGYAIEHRAGARDDMRVARISFTIIRPVPIAPLDLTTDVVHAGRGTSIVTSTLAPAGGPVVMRAEAALIRVAPGTAPAHPAPGRAIVAPAELTDTLTPFPFDIGYHTAMETRYAEGSFVEPGPAAVWFRMRYPLVAGHPIDPLSRVLTAADSGNGVSQVLDPSTHVFVNPELTVHLHRYPDGEWVCLDATSTITADGIGLADTALYDTTGPIGRGTQSLFVAARDSSSSARPAG